MVFSKILNYIGEAFGEDIPEEDLGDPVEFEPSYCVDIGFTWIRILRHILIPASVRNSTQKKACPSPCPEVKMKCPEKCKKFAKYCEEEV